MCACCSAADLIKIGMLEIFHRLCTPAGRRASLGADNDGDPQGEIKLIHQVGIVPTASS